MLSKKSRLNKSEVELLFKKGKSASVEYFFLKSRKNKEEQSRFCITFTSKTSLKGHQRVRIRRQIYEAIRKNEELAPKSLDTAFIIKPSLLKQPGEKIVPAVMEALNTLKKIYG